MTAFHLDYSGGLDAAKEAALKRLYVAVGKARARYLPLLPGQAETNAAKYRAAREHGPGSNSSPWLAAESARRGLSIAAAAQALRNEEESLDSVLAEIERIRLQTEDAIDAVATPRDAFDTADSAIALLDGV